MTRVSSFSAGGRYSGGERVRAGANETMMQSGWCLICGTFKRTEFVLRSLDVAGHADMTAAPVRFVMCSRCGHVYRDPMPDADEWQVAGWPWQPVSRSCDSLDLDEVRFREFDAWVSARLMGDAPDHSLLHIGPPSVGGRRRFAESGWEIYSLADGHGRLRPPLAPEGDGPPPSSFSGVIRRGGRRFAVAVFSAIEQFADPVPLLRALRPFLQAGGALAVAALDLLAPPSSEHLFREFLCSRQMRLYSLNSLLTVLARSGYRAEAVTCFSGGGGLGVIARPVEWEPDHPFDDPEAIRHLYHALGWPGSVEPLGWNLAALAEHQPLVLPLLCQQMESGRYLIRRSGRHVLGVLATTEEGDVVPVVRWGEMDGHPSLLAHGRSPAPGVIVQMGLGSGELASALAQRLGPSQHLFVWEADLALARVVLEAVDLSPLWHRPSVSLLLGDAPPMTREQEELLRRPMAVFSTNTARRWNAVAYRHYLGNLTLADAPSAELLAPPMDCTVPSLKGTA